MSSERASFGSKVGIVLATAGSAVGLGNIWRFPFMTGQNGGAAFILIYILFVVLLGVPGMVCEFVVGRKSASNAARAYRKLSGREPFNIAGCIGYMGVITGSIILGFYAVVAGWCLQYLCVSIGGQMQGDTAAATTYFQNFSGNAWKPALWAVAFILITHFVVVHGVQRGIERASKIMMPVLFLLLLVIVAASCSLPNAIEGIRFLFHPDFSKVTSQTLLGAMGQAFFSLSLGTCCLCTYASYFSRDTNLLQSASQIALVDTLIAILAGLMIFPAAFSVGVNPDSGPSLIFITLPSVFSQAFAAMPVVGYVVSLLFYALLALAALTSTISMHEIGTAFVHEEFGVSRKCGAWCVTVACSLLAVCCSLSVGGHGLQCFGMSLLDFCDFLTGQILLPLGGLLTCLFVGWYVPRRISYAEFTNRATLFRGSSAVYVAWLWIVRIVCPSLILLIFLNQFGLV